jgi:hypothetical protein
LCQFQRYRPADPEGPADHGGGFALQCLVRLQKPHHVSPLDFYSQGAA